MLSGLDGNFRLPYGTADEIREKIQGAIERREIVHLNVELGDNPLDQPTVTINGATLQWFAVIEIGDPAMLKAAVPLPSDS